MNNTSERISIYQVLPRLFGNLNETNQKHGPYEVNGSGKLDDFTHERLTEIRELGCTHVWYIGLLEHATKTSFPDIPADHNSVVKGEAGSPYAIKDYYDVTPTLAREPEKRLEELDQLIERTHKAGLKVIIDFVPNHVARQYHSDSAPSYVQDLGVDDDNSLAFCPQNNYYYLPNQTLHLNFGHESEAYPYTEFPARVTGNDVLSASPNLHDWYETVKLNYGVDLFDNRSKHFDPIPDTWLKMYDILAFWAARGVDGFRCDMAEMVPTAFWNWVITRLKKGYPSLLFIAEIYQPHRYKEYLDAGFDYLYDKVGLYDKLIQVIKGEASTREISYIWQSQEDVKGRMLHFMENHDEQRLASDFIVGDPFKAFPAMAVSVLIDTAPFMTYFGQELGERGMDEEGFSGLDGRTSIFDYWSVSTIRQWLKGDLTEEQVELRGRYKRLLNCALACPSFQRGAFYDLMYRDPSYSERGLYVFLRHTQSECSLVVANFSDQHHEVDLSLSEDILSIIGIKSDIPYRVIEEQTRKEGYALFRPGIPYSLSVDPYGVTVHRCIMEYAQAEDTTTDSFNPF